MGSSNMSSVSAVPEELLRQIQLNLRISTTSSSTASVMGADGSQTGGTSVTKVLISGDPHSSSFLLNAAAAGSAGSM